MKIWLAPMEGLMDFQLRQIVTGFGHIDLTVSEFMRVSNSAIPTRSLLESIPELGFQSQTLSGTPLRVQLMGSNKETLSESAHNALKLGSYGIDFNFGCPSKTVNKRNCGASLLKDPEQIFQIISYARSNLPKGTVISAKVRLGYDDKLLSLDIGKAVESGGADEIVVHGRTKAEGYKPPADWEAIGRLNDSLSINTIINGDIFSADDAERCIKITGCSDIMIGRGAIYNANLAQTIQEKVPALDWQTQRKLFMQYIQLLELSGMAPRYIIGRAKQWIKLISSQKDEAKTLFEQVKALNLLEELKLEITN